MREQQFQSNGKLLLSGEYLILDGAKGLALPTQFGQGLRVKRIHNNTNNRLKWISLDKNNQAWLEVEFNLPDISIVNVDGNFKMAETLRGILKTAKSINPKFLSDNYGIEAQTILEFPRDWGLGSSSTLINNIAQWSATDPFKLLFESFGGSGYDIACARNDTPLIYSLEKGHPKIEKVSFNPPFKDQLFFVHLNEKQSSRDSILNYKKNGVANQHIIEDISKITYKMQQAETLKEFEELLVEHESIMASVLKTITVKEKLFSDFTGQAKSLGAWGGDFILATGNEKTMDYFLSKGYSTVIPYKSMIK